MNKSDCPTNQLKQLVSDELSPQESKRLVDHLESCSTCQSKLESWTADEGWWARAREGLTEVDVDENFRLHEVETIDCSIDTLLIGDPAIRREISTDAILEMLGAPSHPEMLGQIDEFEIEEKIGQGGMGVRVPWIRSFVKSPRGN